MACCLSLFRRRVNSSIIYLPLYKPGEERRQNLFGIGFIDVPDPFSNGQYRRLYGQKPFHRGALHCHGDETAEHHVHLVQLFVFIAGYDHVGDGQYVLYTRAVPHVGKDGLNILS